MVKFLCIFDFDDTLATTDSQVIIRNKDTGEETRLSSEEYGKSAQEYAAAEKAGQIEFDFREFSSIPGAKLIKSRFQKLEGALKNPNAVVKILTARPKSAEKAIHDFIQYNTGRSIDVTAGAHYPKDKAEKIISWIREYPIGQQLNVVFYDDSAANIQKSIDFIKLEKQIDPKRFKDVHFFAHKVKPPQHNKIKESVLVLSTLELIYKKFAK
jgi:hypothetical protein